MNTAVIVIISLAAITGSLYMLKKGINVGIVMLIDSAILIILSEIPFGDALKYSLYSIVSRQTLKLIYALISILVLENIMRSTGMIKTMADSLKELAGSNRSASAFIPAVIGLLPSPGGARFSCPMVEEITGDNSDSSTKSFVNYWFRHIWMDGFLLYPGIILAAELLQISVIGLFIRMVPFMVLRIFIGAAFGFKGIKKEHIIKTKPFGENLKTFIMSMLPVIAVITLYIMLIGVTFLNIKPYSLEISVTSIVVALLIVKKYKIKQIINTLKNAFQLKLIIIIIGVMVFKDILSASGIMEGLPELLNTYGIPLASLYIVLPFLGGVMSGIGVTAVSMSFPVLMHIGLGSNLWYAVLAFSAGFSGCMVTPLHLCAVMTTDYFKSTLSTMLKKIVIAEAVFILAVFIIVYVISL